MTTIAPGEKTMAKKNKNASTDERLTHLEADMRWVKWIVMVGIPFIVLQLFYVTSRLPPIN